MEQTREKKRGLAAIFQLCPVRHVLALTSALVIVLHLLTRDSHAWNRRLSEGVVRPVHRFLARATGALPFSLAEVLILAAAIGLFVYIIIEIVHLFQRNQKKRIVYIIFITLLSFGLMVYALFCLLWGVFYYGDDFITRSGLSQREISVEELETVTAWFAALANDYAAQVPRDGDGVCASDRQAVLARSPALYDAVVADYPSLAGPRVAPKGFHFSRLLSYTDFTGFFFPFTGEANVNMDFPPSLFAATVAHELAHQRGVAKEQEANFVAVLASLSDGDPDYCYSACLLAYTHLGNALYAADRSAWERVYSTLDQAVLRDFAANRAYWQQFETPVQTVSNTVYEGFLQSYDQTLGLKSYGACVDLLVNAFLEEASE